jgi:hypothetical protein
MPNLADRSLAQNGLASLSLSLTHTARADCEQGAHMCGMVVLDSSRRAAMILRMGPFSTSVNLALSAPRPPPCTAGATAALAAAGAAAAAAAAAAPLGGATGAGGPRPLAPCTQPAAAAASSQSRRRCPPLSQSQGNVSNETHPCERGQNVALGDHRLHQPAARCRHLAHHPRLRLVK